MLGKDLFSSFVQPTSALHQMGIAKLATHRVTSPQQWEAHSEGTVCLQLLASHTGHQLSCGEKAVTFLGCEMIKCWGLRRKKGQETTEEHCVAAEASGCAELCTGSVPAQTPPSRWHSDPAGSSYVHRACGHTRGHACSHGGVDPLGSGYRQHVCVSRPTRRSPARGPQGSAPGKDNARWSRLLCSRVPCP